MNKFFLASIVIIVQLKACQKIIDCNGKSFEVTSASHQELIAQCATIVDHFEDDTIRCKKHLKCKKGQSYLSRDTFRLLAQYISDPKEVLPKDPQTLLSLLSAAEYLQAPTSLVRRLWLHTKGKLNRPDLKQFEPEFLELGKNIFSFGEYIKEHHKESIVIDDENRNRWFYPTINSYNEQFKVLNLRGLAQLNTIVDCAKIVRFAIENQKLNDFNLKKFISLMPQLKELSLSWNALKTLKRHHLEGMPRNFRLMLHHNPIAHIEQDCLTSDIIHHANGSRISIINTEVPADLLFALRDQYNEKSNQAALATWIMHHGLLASSFFISFLFFQIFYQNQCWKYERESYFANIVLSICYVFHTVFRSLENDLHSRYEAPSISFAKDTMEFRCFGNSFWPHFKNFNKSFFYIHK